MATSVHNTPPHDRAARNLRTGLLLGALALAFAIGFVIRMWLTS